jgi:hypothetical protein
MTTAFTPELLLHGPDFIVDEKLPALHFIGFIQFIEVDLGGRNESACL